MSRRLASWAPAGALALGLVLVQGVGDQHRMPLRMPLDAAVPSTLEGSPGRDLVISDEEQAVAGMSSYVMRVYDDPLHPGSDDEAAFSVYVGYYESQVQGRTIHSPRNCLPGGGWEPIASTTSTIATADGPVEVNRYTIQNGNLRALVLYWYQGRGRVAWNEYAVKLDLLRDAALQGRSEEALVRVIVPVRNSEEESLALAERVASALVPAVDRALPET